MYLSQCDSLYYEAMLKDMTTASYDFQIRFLTEDTSSVNLTVRNSEPILRLLTSLIILHGSK